MASERTIGDAARSVLADLSPDEQAYLQVSGELVLGHGAASRRARQAALGGGRGNGPTGFGADDVGAIVAFVLTTLNGVATAVLTGEVTQGGTRLHSRWRAWRRRRAITRTAAQAGLATPLPALSALQAARVGQQVRDLAVAAGVTAEQAQRISTLIAAALTSTDATAAG
jgi:hypothetical protein